MAIQKEIWMAAIVEQLFADNSFMSKAFNADEYVNNGKIVHIPNAGAASGVAKNRAELPAAVTKRVDSDVTFNLDEFTTNPILIPNADTVELSYSKRESVLRQDKQRLLDEIANEFIFCWSPTLNKNFVETSGSATPAYVDKATGTRKAFTKADVLELMVKMNVDGLPQEGRYLLLDAQMHAQLLESLTESQANAFLACANAQQGIIGKLYGFNIMLRATVGRYTVLKGVVTAPKSAGDAGDATDVAAGLAWHESAVCRALGEVVAFEKEKDPTYYGDVYSFLVRSGGRKMRSDNKGVYAIVQGTVTEAA